MLHRMVVMSLTLAVLAAAGVAGIAQEKDKKKRGGSLVGEVKSTKPTPNGKNVQLEVLAPGEEKARLYRVQYDPKVKGPMPKVLEAARAAKVGDRVQFEWVDTGEGLAMTSFEILKKATEPKKK